MRKYYLILFVTIITCNFVSTFITLSNHDTAFLSVNELEESETKVEKELVEIDKILPFYINGTYNKTNTINKIIHTLKYSYTIKESICFNVLFSPPDFC